MALNLLQGAAKREYLLGKMATAQARFPDPLVQVFRYGTERAQQG